MVCGGVQQRKQRGACLRASRPCADGPGSSGVPLDLGGKDLVFGESMESAQERSTIVPRGRVGRVVSINRSNGGVPKLAAAEAMVTRHGMEGDRQRNRL